MMKLKTQVFEALRHMERGTSRDIAAHLGIDPHLVATTLHRLKADGAVVHGDQTGRSNNPRVYFLPRVIRRARASTVWERGLNWGGVGLARLLAQAGHEKEAA